MASPPRSSYERLRESFQEMQSSTTLDDLQDAWEDFLVYYQRTWNRCQAYYRGNPYWGPLLPKYAGLRANDALLDFVHQARHADEHGIDPSSHVKPGSTTVGTGAYTGGTRITGGGDYVLGAGSTEAVKVNPATVATKPVVNRGNTFSPPVLNGKQNPPVMNRPGFSGGSSI